MYILNTILIMKYYLSKNNFFFFNYKFVIVNITTLIKKITFYNDVNAVFNFTT